MKVELVDHIELFKIMMENGVATPVETFFGYRRYLTVSEGLIPPSVECFGKLRDMDVSYKYIGRYMTADYNTVDVYGVECSDKTAMLIKMIL